MFSVEYYNRTVIISSYNIRRLNFRYQVKLKKLLVQAMKQSCDKIVINLVGVRLIDRGALDMLKLMADITHSLGISLRIMNLDNELSHHIRENALDIVACLATEEETLELAELIV